MLKKEFGDNAFFKFGKWQKKFSKVLCDFTNQGTYTLFCFIENLFHFHWKHNVAQNESYLRIVFT